MKPEYGINNYTNQKPKVGHGLLHDTLDSLFHPDDYSVECWILIANYSNPGSAAAVIAAIKSGKRKVPENKDFEYKAIKYGEGSRLLARRTIEEGF